MLTEIIEPKRNSINLWMNSLSALHLSRIMSSMLTKFLSRLEYKVCMLLIDLIVLSTVPCQVIKYTQVLGIAVWWVRMTHSQYLPILIAIHGNYHFLVQPLAIIAPAILLGEAIRDRDGEQKIVKIMIRLLFTSDLD